MVATSVALPTKAAAPTPTPAAGAPQPTMAPAGKTASPQPTRAGIAVQNATPEKQADGNIRTTAKVSVAESIGIGQMELSAPDAMLLTDSRSIRLRLSPSQQFAALTPVAAPGKTPDLPSLVYRFAGNVEMYPVMFAELRGLNFEMDQKGRIRRNIEAGKTIEWVWVVKPLAAGQQELVLELSIPTIVNGVASEMNTNVLQNLPIVIQVTVPPTVPAPTSTPTPVPKSATDRIIDSMIENAGALLAASIGVIGTILGSLFALITRSKSKSH
jgi:hypothetical protein